MAHRFRRNSSCQQTSHTNETSMDTKHSQQQSHQHCGIESIKAKGAVGGWQDGATSNGVVRERAKDGPRETAR